MAGSVRDYAILWVGVRQGSGGAAILGGNAIASTSRHALDGPEHTDASDDTRLDATADHHGLLMKLSGVAEERLDGEGVFRVIPADEVAVTDGGGYFTGTDVEAVLQEIGAGTSSVVAASDLTTRYEPHVAYDGTIVLNGNGDPVMVEVAN